MTDPSGYKFARAIAELRAVHVQLLQDDPDLEQDQKLLADMLDGEGGDAMQILDAMISATALAEGLATEAFERAKRVAERGDRYARRVTRFRAGIAAAMEALGLQRRETPEATAAFAKGRNRVVITDESQLPPEFVTVEMHSAPNKLEIKAALQSGRDVPGASLANPQPSLRITRL